MLYNYSYSETVRNINQYTTLDCQKKQNPILLY